MPTGIVSKTMKRVLGLAVILASTTSFSQDAPALRGPVVTLAPPPTISIVQGKSGTVPLSYRIAKGYHINSNQPKSEFLIPTSLKMDATTDIVIGKTTYPDGKDMSFAFAPDEKLNVYSGDFEVDVLVRPLKSVVPGKYMIRGNLKYQACDNAACYPPKTLPVNFEVKITKAAAAARKNPAQSPNAHR
jgi:thiol:disulfide interchange protein